MTLDLRALRLIVIWAWALFLLWLWLSGEVLRYLGPRTQWVVVVGAVALPLVAIAYGRAGTSPESAARPSRAEVAGSIGLVLPIALAMGLAGSTLGSLAASKKLAGRGVDLATLARLESGDSSSVTFLDLKAAEHDPGLARDKEITVGRAITLTGFVSHAPLGRARGFELSRFYITCCVADSIPVGVDVEPAATETLRPQRDEWVIATGAIAHDGRGYYLRALRIRPTHAPKNPYLTFAS
jgi:putative membrane protein